MPKFLIKGIIAVVLIISVIITILALFNNLTQKSFYPENGYIELKEVEDTVIIYKDDFGVSHINAKNENDLYFALGYIHSQDRLWQMDIMRRAAEGRLSEIIGDKGIEIDKMFRTIGIGKIAGTIYENSSKKSKEILESYAKGVNYFIQYRNSKLPLEFDVLNYKPYEWKPEHSVMAARMMGWQLNFSWVTKYVFGEIARKFGLERAKEFYPDYPDSGPFIIKTESKKSDKESEKKKETGQNNLFENSSIELAQYGKDFLKTDMKAKELLGFFDINTGSNSWVINGTKSENKKPILANDPHLALSSPSMWYEVEMKCGNTDFNVCGFSLPGAPGVIIGHNEKIAWGITNLMNDDADFYVLNRDPANRNKYLYNENSIFLDSTEEEIYIKDEKEPLYYFTYRTKLGPVISDLEKTNLSNETKFKVRGDQLLTFKWTGFEMTDETKAIYEINRADKWDKFRDALKSFGLPASNFTYADVNGNIGYQAAGLIPIRKNLESNSQQFYPSTEDIMWAGFVNFDELPKAFNPPEGYIVTANNKPLKDYKHYISNLYEPPYRAERIEALLKARNNFNAKEFELIQNDVVDLKAKEYCKYIFEAYKDSLNLNSEEKQCLDRLKKWDYAVNVFSTEASIISEFEIQLFKYLYKDKLGEELFEQYVQLNNIPIRNTLKILKEESSWLYDLSGTTRTEKREFIIKKSFRDAIDNLSKIFGTQDNTKWTWNELHKIEIRHPLGVVPALSPVLNVGPYDLGGCGTTIAYSGYSIFKAYKNNDFNSFVGQSCKFVIDLSNTSLHYSVIPTGQSGQPLHYNYKDQTRLWLSGQYKTVVSDIIELKKEKLSAITLAPY